MNFVKILSILFIGVATSAHAVWIGDYRSTNNTGPNSYSSWLNVVVFDGVERGTKKKIAICVDNTTRMVPGKNTISTCDVEWKGTENANQSFSVLVNENYQWVQLTSSNKAYVIDRGVSPGVVDEGGYVYHCRITLSDGTITAGKYIPSRDGCYYGLWGAHYRTLAQAKLEILIKP